MAKKTSPRKPFWELPGFSVGVQSDPRLDYYRRDSYAGGGGLANRIVLSLFGSVSRPGDIQEYRPSDVRFFWLSFA